LVLGDHGPAAMASFQCRQPDRQSDTEQNPAASAITAASQHRQCQSRIPPAMRSLPPLMIDRDLRLRQAWRRACPIRHPSTT